VKIRITDVISVWQHGLMYRSILVELASSLIFGSKVFYEFSNQYTRVYTFSNQYEGATFVCVFTALALSLAVLTQEGKEWTFAKGR
jgi:hypothetical protein